LYDSPTTGDDFPAGKEYNEGEYLVLIKKSGILSSRSGIDLDLSVKTLHAGDDSLLLSDTPRWRTAHLGIRGERDCICTIGGFACGVGAGGAQNLGIRQRHLVLPF
jgi:hypothetical protein